MPRITRASHAAAVVTKTPNPVLLQLSSPPATPKPSKQALKNVSPRSDASMKVAPATGPVTPPRGSRKRTRTEIKNEEANAELPHNLSSSLPDVAPLTTKKTTTHAKKPKTDIKLDEDVKKAPAAKTAPGLKGGDANRKKAKKPKDTTYGLIPGQTPFPEWSHPTLEECYEVNRILSKLHGNVNAPKTIPKPSLTVSGCGEVPSVLDALIRTRLSAATSGTNSSRAFQGLVQRFGVIKEGIGKGSVDWDTVRRADIKEVFEAIKSGGLAQVKSKDIKEILQQVYEENQARREALLNHRDSPVGDKFESQDEKDREVALAESSVISLDHLHLLSDKEAFDKLVRYPGIGPKTASCVLLFCLQRPSFAVDTHVFRLCSWLGWVPPNATRNTAYAHCDVRIPDELKYPLHQLLIKHGKTCPRCRANTSETYRGWDDGCVIDHLVKRTGVRKGGADGESSTTPKKKSKSKKIESDEEDELSELSDLSSDEE